MHKSTKAALISAFIFPGFGHFYLKSKLRGAVFTLISVGCLYLLTTYVMDIANDISNKILSGDIPSDITRLIVEISSQLTGSQSNPPNVASLLLFICWGIATVDSYILGRKLSSPTNTK
jgi:hypothetical protein